MGWHSAWMLSGMAALLAGCATRPSALPTAYGVQLYTVRAAMAQDFEGTLRRVADIGYSEVEFAGLFGHDPATVAGDMKRLGLRVAGSHVDWQRLRDDPAGAIAEAKALGSPYVVFAWMPPEQRHTLEQWNGWIARINQFAKMAHAAGLQFAYHNHDFEFVAINGVRPIDLLMAGLDRRYVKFEMDVYWLVRGGGTPAAFFQLYPGGFPLLHVKDMSRIDMSMVDVGDGRIDFRAIFAQSQLSGATHLLVEHDSSADPFRSLERSLAYLRQLKP